MECPGYYSIIPATVRYDKNLTANAKLLYGEITALANKEGYCWASNSYFAELYSVSTDTIKRHIRQLKESGYVFVEVMRDDNNQVTERRIYVLDDPSGQKSPHPHGKNAPHPQGKNVPHNNTRVNTTNNKDIVGKVISYLNVKTAQGYRATSKSTQRHINARIGEGFVLEDFYAVIDSCNTMWGNDEKMRRYLRPETLFGTKFESYLQAARSAAPKRLEYDDEGWL